MPSENTNNIQPKSISLNQKQTKDINYLICFISVAAYIALRFILPALPSPKTVFSVFVFLGAFLFIGYLLSIFVNIFYGFVTLQKYSRSKNLIGFTIGAITCIIGFMGLIFFLKDFFSGPF